MLTKLKQKIQQALTLEAKAAHKIGLTPNRISALGFILAVFSSLLYWQWQTNKLNLIFAALLLILSGFCDALDGVAARLFHQTSDFGGFLDSLLDRYEDAIVYATIIIAGLCDATSGLAALIGSLLVSYSRARAEAANVKMESIGLAERAERIIILAAATIIASYWLPALTVGIIIIAILANLTVIQRTIYAYKKLRKKESD